MTATDPREPAMDVRVSFDGSGVFDDPIDALTDRLAPGTLTIVRGRDEVSGSGRPRVPEFAWDAHNDDRQLSNFLASSARYRLVRPGKPARIQMTGGSAPYAGKTGYTGSWFWGGKAAFTLATGILKTPTQRTAPGDRAVSFSAVGQTARLEGTPISTPLYQNIRTDQAISHVLDRAGWPTDKRQLAFGDTTFLYWWLDEQEPLAALADILATEGIPAAIFERGDGTLVFQNRNYRGTAPASTRSQVTYYDRYAGRIRYAAALPYSGTWPYGRGGNIQLYHSGIEDDPSYEDIFNAATMTVRRRAIQPLQKVWEYGGPLALASGQTLDVIAVLPEPSTGAIAPVQGTDFLLPAGALASPPSIVEANAQRVTLRFVAAAGGATVVGVTSNGPQLRATPATVVSESQARNGVDASDSIAENGGFVRTYAVQARPEISQAAAVTLCDSEVAHRQFQRSRIRLLVNNIDADHLVRQLTTEISQRISVVSTQLGYGVAGESGDFWVEQIEYRRVDTGLQMVLSCQQALSESGGALWDSDLWDVGLWAR